MSDNKYSEAVEKDAVISKCGTYRYKLFRAWSENPRSITWIMLNPSTADASIDDPTIRRCIRFSQAFGVGRMWVVNLFAYRATDPGELSRSQVSIFGPDNNRMIEECVRSSETIVAAYGANKLAIEGAKRLKPLLKHRVVHCLGKTLNGNPKHPLYIPDGTELQTFWEPQPPQEAGKGEG